MTQPIRLMTANLLVDQVDLGYLANVLDVIDPDLLVIQELGHKTADLIASRFRYQDVRPQLDAKGRGIASRFPASFGEIPLPSRGGMWARIEHGSLRWLVATIHVKNVVNFPWWRSVRLRGQQIDALFAWADAEQDGWPLVLAGDMNASPAWPLYRRLSERWEDLVARSADDSGKKPAPTWAWRPGWPRVLRIDHVFGVGARAVESRVVPLRGTDHAALIVDLLIEPSR
jgi:endonuclease/exonuclease/phosphatase (EEP) superfamily protein YafD